MDLTAVSSSFHRNVLLLTQMIAPNEDFKKYFREGMFDKPNTPGFIFVSHYLLTIYDSDRVRILIEWPVLCKKTEAKYRNGIKNFLGVIATENSDIGFPPVLASHLFHATGTKFVTIMWKLSQVTLRRYLKTQGGCNVSFAPKLGPAEDLAKIFFKRMTMNAKGRIRIMHEDLMQMDETVDNFAMEQAKELNAIKEELFERKRSLRKITSEAPVESSVAKRLLDVEDEEIIPMWKTSIQGSFKYVQKRYAILKDIKDLASKISNIVTNRTTGSQVLDSKQMARIHSFIELPIPAENQYLLYHLYVNEKLVLNNFLLLFNVLSKQLYRHLKRNGLKDMSLCLAQLKASTEDVKSASNAFKNLLSTALHSSEQVRHNLSQKNQFRLHSVNTFSSISNAFLLESPLIKINTNCIDEKDDLQKQFELTPVEGIHKSLFSRYKRHATVNMPQATNTLVTRINFDETISSCSEIQLPSTKSTSKINRVSAKQTGKYSHLFSWATKNHVKANYSTLSTPGSAKANSTAVANITGDMHNILDLSLDITGKSSFNASKETTPKHTNAKDTKSENIFDDAEDERGNVFNKVNEITVNDTTEVIFTNDGNSKNTLTKSNGNSRRRSISDLVERYNKLLSNRAVSFKNDNVLENNE